EAAFGRDAERLEANALRARTAADGHQHLFGLEAAPVRLRDDARPARLHRADLHPGLDGDPAAREAAGELRADFFVLDRHDARQRLEQRDLHAVRAVDVGELDADGAGADDDDRLR